MLENILFTFCLDLSRTGCLVSPNLCSRDKVYVTALLSCGHGSSFMYLGP